MGTVEALFSRSSDDDDLRIASIPRELTSDERKYTTGLPNIDEMIKPMKPGGFVIIGAREGQGKSAYIERLAMENAHNHRILFASLDMPREVVQERILCKVLSEDAETVNLLAKENHPRYVRAMQHLAKFDLLVWSPPTGRRTVKHIIKRAEDVSAEILIVDYTALLEGWVPGYAARPLVDYIADWAHASGVLTIMLSQLKDEAVNKRPHNGHIQDSSRLVQRADRVQLIHRPFHGRQNKDDIAEILTTKNRWGSTGRNHVGWVGCTMDFYPYSGEEEANAACCKRHKPKPTPLDDEGAFSRKSMRSAD